MQHSKTADTLVGLFVAAGIAALFFLGLQVSNLGDWFEDEGYSVTARFQNSGGLKPRAVVSIAGVRIGRVTSIRYDSDTFQSVVTMRIDRRYDRIPDDTSASILTAGLLGEQYIGLDPGGSLDYLSDGSEIEITQSAMVLEKLISQFLFDKASGTQSTPSATAAPSTTPPHTEPLEAPHEE